MKRACAIFASASALFAGGCATDPAAGGADLYGGIYYGYDDWWYGGGYCCVDYPGDIGPPGPHPEHPIALPPGGGARPEQPIAKPPSQPKATSSSRSMPAPRASAPMRGGGGGMRGGGGRR